MPYNPSNPDTVGLEWAVTDPGPSTFVLDSVTKSVGGRVAGLAGVGLAQSMGIYLAAVTGQPVVGGELYSSPFLDSVAQSFDVDYPGTDTGKDTTSPLNGGQAWVTQAGGAASFANVGPGADDVTYLKNVNGFEAPGASQSRMLFRGANAISTLAKAGKRVLSVEVRARVKSTQSGPPQLTGALNLSGTIYPGTQVSAPTNSGYVDLSLGTWYYNPRTGVPWTLADVNLLLSTGATDSFGMTGWWLFQAADTLRVSSLYLRTRWQPEDRLGYAFQAATAPGWQTLAAKSTPNLLSKQDSNLDANTGNVGTWAAGANTTLANDTVTKAGWTRSLKATATAAGVYSATTGFYPCIATKKYSLSCYALTAAGRNVTSVLSFYDSTGNLLVSFNVSTSGGTGSYNAMSVNAAAVVAPAGATQMKAGFQSTATAGAQTFNVQGIVLALDQTAQLLVFDLSAGGASGTKVDGGSEQAYMTQGAPSLQVVRKVSGTGVASVPLVPAGAGAVGNGTSGGTFSYRPVLQDASGAIYSLGAARSDSVPAAVAALHNVEASNGPESSYSTPYVARVAARVDAGNTPKSELTLPAGTFLNARFVVAAAVDPPAAALLVKLKRVSDNVQVGSTLTVNPTDLAQVVAAGGSVASRTTPQVFVGSIGSAATTAQQYYLEFTSAAAAGSGWWVYALDNGAYVVDSVSIDTVSYAGGADAFTDPATVGRSTHRNGMATVQTAPVAPTVTAAVA